jgi:membrane protease YdiL (CAAX protease family)
MVSLSRNGRKMSLELQESVPAPEKPNYSVPWKYMDNWIGVTLLVLIDLTILILTVRSSRAALAQSALIVVLELAYLLPVILIFAWRRVNWKAIGFGRFDPKVLGIGCGLLVGAYLIIILHNLLLFVLKVDTQGEEIVKVFNELNSPVWFFIVGAVFAPFVEEIFFRGFLFQGFRERYGWKVGMLLSSAIFGAAHLDLAALIPTFILGNVLAYLYHRSNSVWPGIFLHFLVNAFGLFGAYFVTHYQNLIPL